MSALGTLRAALCAACLTAPMGAQAGSSLSLALSPRDAREAQLLGAAISVYALHRDLRAQADTRQRGQGHRLALRQSGDGNRAILRQRGAGHALRLDQAGGGNTQVVVQIGRGAQADIRQQGGQAGVLIQLAR